MFSKVRKDFLPCALLVVGFSLGRVIILDYYFFFLDDISCNPGWPQTQYVAELLILLPLPLSAGVTVHLHTKRLF